MQSNNFLMEPSEYWQILMRHKFKFLVPFIFVIAASVTIAMVLPAVYRSEATILIQRQSVPQNLVATTVTGYVKEQIEQIRQRITNRITLLEIADEFALYVEDFETDPTIVAQQMKDNIEVEMLDVETSDPDRSGRRLATVAFTIAYNAETPEIAQGVTADIAERFLRNHRVVRSEMAEDVSEFLSLEADNLKVEIADLERQLAGFKQEEIRQLPELMSMNLQLFERTEQQIQFTEDRIRALRDRLESLRAELSLTEPYAAVINEQGQRVLTASERLSMLTASYLQGSARYSQEHPDIVRLSREIRILAEQTGDLTRVDELMGQLVNLQEQLRQARQRYSDAHPEVARLETAVAAVQRGMQTSIITPDKTKQELEIPPDNPRYVTLRTQLDTNETNIKVEEQKLTDLEAKLEEYEERLYQTPIVERDYRSLSRGYEDALRKFSELNQKLLQAEIAETLEAGQRAEQWRLIGGAYLPIMPESPNRIGIVLLGIMLSIMAGLGSVTVAEYLDKTIRSARRITALLGSPPLVVIPYIPATNESINTVWNKTSRNR
ncbi:MAG: hypothetical protein VYE04_18750 [Pseudomonadota bacterium]|nr:hypothetical protein [Pseudomonadota bacterium]